MATAKLSKSLSLPFLPGCVPHDLHKPKNFRPQTLAYRLDASVDNRKLGFSAEGLRDVMNQLYDPTWRFKSTGQKVLNGEQRRAIAESTRNTYRPRKQPAWLKHTRQVLRFEAFFQEKVEESAMENFRYRHCTILYYLEDSTCQVIEGRIENSGIPQGAFIKRHVIPKADGSDSIRPYDFRLGGEIEIYGKVFHICKCDNFTKWFFEESGLELGEEQTPPADMHEKGEDHKEMTRTKAFGIPRGVIEGQVHNELSLGGARKNDKLEQFLKNDGKVLRFYSFWNDHTRYGARQYQVIHFFLCDDTVEILDQYQRNSGRDPFPVLLKRGQLNKNFQTKAVPSMLEPDPIMVMPSDLICGQELQVLGRSYFIYDCDDFTRMFYKEFFDLDQQSFPGIVADTRPTHQQLAPPPHSGLGSEEDSMASVIDLRPKIPKQDLVKLTTLDGKILRFEARCANFQIEDEDRRFIIAIYAANETVACYEIKKRNSGCMEGRFAERGRKKNSSTGEWFKPADFFVGQTVVISSMPMYIIRADEYTLKYMEDDPSQFAVSSPEAILSKISVLRGDADLAAAGSIDPDTFRDAVMEKTGILLVDHELITLLRRFGEPSDEPLLDLPMIMNAMNGAGHQYYQ